MNVLFYLIKCVRKNETPILDKEVSVEKLIKFADRRGVLSYVYASLEKAGYHLPAEYKIKIDSEKKKKELQIYYKDKLKRAFIKNGIPFAYIKGDDIARYLPKGAERFSCDVDFFYPIKYRKSVSEVMKKLGFTCNVGGMGTDDFSIEPKISFEGHYDLDCGFKYNPYKDFSRFEKRDGVFYMKPEDVYVYHIIHFANHFKNAGCGFRALVDAYFLTENINTESEYIKLTLERVGLSAFNETVKKAVSACFECGAHDDYLKWFVGSLLSGGIYGTSVNRTKVLAYNTKNYSKTRLFFKRAFPPYKEMKIAYPCIGKCPIVLPFFWLYRLLKVGLLSGRKVKQEIKDIKYIDKDSLTIEREYYRRLRI